MGIWVGRYAIANGQVQEHGPWLAERGRNDGDGAARLLVLTEPVDQRSGEFCHEVASAVAELFARETLSITGGLLRALEQAHGNLAELAAKFSQTLTAHRDAYGLRNACGR